MRSISTSETSDASGPRDESILVEARGLQLVFNADVHRPWAWRDVFARVGRDPIGLLAAEKDRLHVARDLSFQIRRGDRVGLLGVNGAGKTSLCRCIAGFYRPTSGELRLRGRVRAIFDTGVGIHPELTGRENAELLARFLYPELSRRGDIDALVRDALEFSELGRFIDIPYHAYSNGMQARLCLSIISSRPCDLLLLDEVFEGADAFFREKIAARFLKMIEGSGAVLFVSHSMDQVRSVCNRVLILDQGRIVFDGGVDEGIAAYAGLGPRAPIGSRSLV